MGTSTIDKKILVILGPTATGKTDVALVLARKFNGELVSCDSRQVYQGLDIGTGKLPGSEKWKVKCGSKKWEVGGINIWMYDVVSFKKQYTVYDYVKDTDSVIAGILARRKLPIIVGGTGLYLKGLLYGFSNLGIPIDINLRKSLERLSLDDLQKKLQELSKDKWGKLNLSDQKNSRRLVRAIELELSPRRSPYGHLRGGMKSYDTLKIGLSAPREFLYKRIDERVISRIDQGMIEEAESLYKKGLSLKRMRQLGLEYGVLADYLDNKITKDDLIKIMQGKIHHYARRQITWFKKEKDVGWFDITIKDFAQEVEKKVAKWYYYFDDSEN